MTHPALSRRMSPPSRAAWIEIKHESMIYINRCCRRLHGRRGLKSLFDGLIIHPKRRRLHGRRGLKYRATAAYLRQRGSPPSRAAWIEITVTSCSSQLYDGRRLHGRRGLKSIFRIAAGFACSRRLHGRRGLKYGYARDRTGKNCRRLHGRRGLKWG